MCRPQGTSRKFRRAVSALGKIVPESQGGGDTSSDEPTEST